MGQKFLLFRVKADLSGLCCILGGAIGLGLASGCVNPNLESELSRLRKEILSLKEDHKATQDRLSALETGQGASIESSEVVVANPPARENSLEETPPPQTIAQRQGVPELPVVRVGVEKQLETPSRAAIGAQDRGEPPVMIRIRGRQTDRLAVDHQVLNRPDPVLDRPRRRRYPDPEYQRALRTLRKKRDPRAALTLFDNFIKHHAGHHLEDNAVYWSGEAHQMLLEHTEALEFFNRVIQRYPRSNKVSWAKLRIAQSYLALGQREEGQALLQQLRSEHPESEPAELARDELER